MAETITQEDMTILESVLFNVFTGVVNCYEILVHHIDGCRLCTFGERDTDRAVSTPKVKAGIAFLDIQMFN